MKAYRAIVTATLLVIGATWCAGGGPLAQSVLPPRLLSRATPPPEIRGLETPKLFAEVREKRPNRADLLAALERRSPGSTKINTATHKNPLRATIVDAPREVRELEAYSAARSSAMLKTRPTLQELFGRIRALPGGREKLEEAQRRGARISSVSRGLRSALTWFDAFVAAPAWAQGSFEVWLTPWTYVPPPYRLDFTAVDVRWLEVPAIKSNPPGSAIATFKVPSTGWYILGIDVGVRPGVSITVEHYEPETKSGSPWSRLDSWVASGPVGGFRTTFPTLVELESGMHCFKFACASGSAAVVSVGIKSM